MIATPSIDALRTELRGRRGRKSRDSDRKPQILSRNAAWYRVQSPDLLLSHRHAAALPLSQIPKKKDNFHDVTDQGSRTGSIGIDMPRASLKCDFYQCLAAPALICRSSQASITCGRVRPPDWSTFESSNEVRGLLAFYGLPRLRFRRCCSLRVPDEGSVRSIGTSGRSAQTCISPAMMCASELDRALKAADDRGTGSLMIASVAA